MRALALVLALALAQAAAAAEPPSPPLPAEIGDSLSIDQAVAVALARNRDVIAARLEIEAAELDRVAAGLYPNPIFGYTLGNIVVGTANPQGMNVRAGPFDQKVHTVSLSEIVDIWAKRSARIRTAERGIEHRRLLTEDALREITYGVRAAFLDVVREQSEFELSVQTRGRYEETVRLSRARFAAGDISEAEVRKVELESLRYQNAVIDAEAELGQARQKLLALLALPSDTPLPRLVSGEARRVPYEYAALVAEALERRPDVRAVRAARGVAESSVRQEDRNALPDISVGLAYTHSEFVVSGDNPNSMALSVSLPLPLFDRNQANRGRAALDMRRADNDLARLRVEVQRDVGDVVLRARRARTLLDVFEGGMTDRAETALKVAENSYKAGSISLLELLEAQRTYIDTRAQYLRAQHDYRQAAIDVAHVLGGEPR